MTLTPSQQKFFTPGSTIYHASAPGRLDVMGGIGDYSGSLVLQMPIQERTHVWLALRDDHILRAHSHQAQQPGLQDTVEFDLNRLPAHGALEYSSFHQALTENPAHSWAAYIFGCLLCLMLEKKIPPTGVDFWVESDIPFGKGVSSSAALEVAAMTALCAALELELSDNELPILAQKVENLIVGAPCGLMDQLATYHGKQNQLLPILCRPDRIFPTIEIPEPLHFIGVDSGVRHSVGGSSYTGVRTAAFMGYTIIASRLGISRETITRAKQTPNRDLLPYHGYLTEISPSALEALFLDSLPEQITGAEFIEQYGTTIDPITSPKPDTIYPVRVCTSYPIYENHRVHQFQLILRLLGSSPVSPSLLDQCCHQLGELMYQAHVGYSRCGLGSTGTDHLVTRAWEHGESQAIFGAKITGGGSGGTVCFLCRGEQGKQSVHQIAAEYSASTGTGIKIFDGSSDGARWTEVEKIPY
ncbi:MAG: galactokinase [bacterium]|jgi:galactokinase